MMNRFLEKSLFIYFSFILLGMFINLSLTQALECNYSPIASFDEYGNYGGPLPDYSLPEDKKWLIDQGYYITLNSYNSGTGYPGGDETLKNWDNKDYCPNFIRTTLKNWECFFCDGYARYGYDDLDSAKSDGKDYDTIYIYDEYLKELQSETPRYDHTVDYSCDYKAEGFKINFNKDGYALSAENTSDTASGLVDYSYELSDAMRTTQAIEPGKCEDAYICLSNTINSANYNKYYYTVFSDEEDYERNKSKCKDSIITGIIHNGTDEYENGCRTHQNDIKKLKEYWEACNSNGTMCLDYKNLKDEVASLCNNITKYSDYQTSKCLRFCLEFDDKIIEIEKKEPTVQICGFSEKLILWIANIIRWVKYIVPVAVIVLGILDFMKAISADKEDEMKKAQQRFIRRLIAAALIFIAPFIIEFILNKLGFAANGCGIINL